MISIAAASFKEAVRKKIFILVGIITLVYLGLFFLITYYTVQDMNKYNYSSGVHMVVITAQIVSVLGFYFSSMLVAFLTIMASIGAVSSEIESGTIHSIITKPVKRAQYILGKYLGLAVLVVGYSVFLYIAVMVICAAVKLPLLGNLGIMTLAKGLGFFILEPLAILSLSILGSTIFKTLTNSILVIAIYILGLIGGMMEQIGGVIKNESIYVWGIISSLLSPFDVIYRQMIMTLFSSVGITNVFFGSTSISGTVPSIWMNIYIALYLLGLLAIAVRKFERKDIS